MEFVKVMKALKVVCRKNHCDICPMYEWRKSVGIERLACIESLLEYPEEAEKIIKEHGTVKTREELIKEQYPNIPLGTDGVPAMCVRHLGYPLYDPKMPVCTLPGRYCFYCWTKEVEKK